MPNDEVQSLKDKVAALQKENKRLTGDLQAAMTQLEQQDHAESIISADNKKLRDRVAELEKK